MNKDNNNTTSAKLDETTNMNNNDKLNEQQNNAGGNPEFQNSAREEISTEPQIKVKKVKARKSKGSSSAPAEDAWMDKPKDTKATFVRLMRELAQQKGRLIGIIICTIFSSLLFVAVPILMGVGVDNIIEVVKKYGLTAEGLSYLPTVLAVPVLMLALVSLMSCFMSFLQQRLMASVGETLVLRLRKHISSKLTKLPLQFFDTHKTGDLISRTNDDLEKVAEVMQTGALQLASAAFSIVVTIIVMFVLSPLLTLIVLVSLVAATIATKWISRIAERSFAANQKTIGELNAKVEEYYSGNVIIKAFNKQQDSTNEIELLNKNQHKAHKKAQFINFAIYPSIRFLSQIGFIATAIVGGSMVVSGQMTVGTIQALLQYINQISEPVTQASYVINSLQAALAGAERVFEILNEQEEIADKVEQPGESFAAAKTNIIDSKHSTNSNMLSPNTAAGFADVRFEHVKFGYSPDRILMNDVSFSVSPNEMVAIVGPTGAGKTTLVNLLMRFYELNGGNITIGGVNINDISRGKLRRRVGMVLQDTWLFQGTVADNIAYGKMNATREEIVAAATVARCDHFIRTLPEGYDTVISSEASVISQGQMQLLTIARAMLASPDIMILDEATSSVDTRTEMEIQKAMNEVMQAKTSFVIAHRLSTIKTADLILVMKDGTIIEKGTHAELLQAKTFYADLYNSQFAQGTIAE